MLQKETKYGLTFGQILSLLTVVSGILVAWVSLNVRIAQAEMRIKALEYGFEKSLQRVETIRQENREDHRELMLKLEDIARTSNSNK